MSSENTARTDGGISKPETQTIHTQAPVPTMSRIDEHGRYRDLTAAVDFLGRGARALEGIGNLMRPELREGDEQLTLCRRSEAAAVFEFFGEAMKGAAADAESAIGFFEMRGYVASDR